MNWTPEQIDKWRRNIRESTLGNYHYQMGATLEHAGQREQALSMYDRAVQNAPREARAWLGIIRLLTETGRSPEADAARASARAIDPNFAANGLAALVSQILERDGLKAASQALHDAISQGASNNAILSEAALEVGNATFRTNDYPAAIPWFERACQWGPDNPQSHLRFATASLRCGNAAAAKAAANRTIDLDPTQAEAWFIIGQASIALGEFDAALASFDQALAFRFRAPSSVYCYSTWILLIKGDLEKASQCVDAWLASAPSDRSAQAVKFLVRHRSGKVLDAWAGIAAMIDSTPNDALLLAYAAAMKAAGADIGEAVTLAKRAVSAAPDWSLCQAALAGAALIAGEESLAEQAIADANRTEALWVDFFIKMLWPEPTRLLALVRAEQF